MTSTLEIATLCAVSRRTVRRWKARGIVAQRIVKHQRKLRAFQVCEHCECRFTRRNTHQSWARFAKQKFCSVDCFKLSRKATREEVLAV